MFCFNKSTFVTGKKNLILTRCARGAAFLPKIMESPRGSSAIIMEIGHSLILLFPRPWRAQDFAEEPIWFSHLFVRKCVIFVYLRVRVSLLSRAKVCSCVQWGLFPTWNIASAYFVSSYLIWSPLTCVWIFDVWTQCEVMKCLVSTHIYIIWVAQSYFFYQRNRSIVHGGERDTLSEAVVSQRTVVTFVTWLISRIEFLV